MTIHPWPGFKVFRFEMRVQQNLRVFTGPYSPVTQALDLLGERWVISMALVATVLDDVTAAALEAFWDRLKGQVNALSIGHQRLKAPLGTLRGGNLPAQWVNSTPANANWVNASSAAATWLAGSPVIAADIAQLASTGAIRTIVGYTLRAGDLISIGGQLVRILADTVADGTGVMPIEFTPRARALIPAVTPVLWDAPTANFILKPGTTGVPTSWTPGMVDGATIELVEVY